MVLPAVRAPIATAGVAWAVAFARRAAAGVAFPNVIRVPIAMEVEIAIPLAPIHAPRATAVGFVFQSHLAAPVRHSVVFPLNQSAIC